ncbi:MAG: L-seryl-tRNA(Sec) selenium transferase [Bacillota bacterium]
MTMHLLRQLPSVDQVLAVAGTTRYSRRELVDAIRQVLEGLRQRIRSGEPVPGVDTSTVALLALNLLQRTIPGLRPVVNATGIILHTNLGRARLAEDACRAVEKAARGYTNLEYDLETGERGSRHGHVRELLTRLTGAEEALVVNNNAAAVLLVLNTLSCGREVIVSRGQLVEIGGSFRLPAVMESGGCRLVEVGTTNRTYLSDYESAITPQTALILRVHPSNFVISGYHHEPTGRELAQLAARHNLPLVEDLGSGVLVDLSPLGLPAERTVSMALEEGAGVVTFSGDKLLGGPQAGVICGLRHLVEAARKNALARALRVDKLTLAALEATLRLYYDPGRARAAIPTLAALSAAPAQLKKRARRLCRRLSAIPGHGCRISVEEAKAPVGGGSLPGVELLGFVVRVEPPFSVNRLEAGLRLAPVPVVGRVEGGALLLDVRTIADDEFSYVEQALVLALGEQEGV